MRTTKLVKVVDAKGKKYSATVKELTVAEVRSWLVANDRAKAIKESAELEDDITISNIIFSDFTLFDLELMMDGITVKQMMHFAPSQLDKIFAVAKEVNPDFFRIISSLYQINDLDEEV